MTEPLTPDEQAEKLVADSQARPGQVIPKAEIARAAREAGVTEREMKRLVGEAALRYASSPGAGRMKRPDGAAGGMV